jgi:hypothetical protein
MCGLSLARPYTPISHVIRHTENSRPPTKNVQKVIITSTIYLEFKVADDNRKI